MVSFRNASVDEPGAHALLAEYFDLRAGTFPQDLGAYSTSFPAAIHFTPPAGAFLIVVEDGEDIGCGGIRVVPADPPEPVDQSNPPPVRYEIKHLWIQPRMQGRQFGRALLNELERRARELGATEVVLDTNASLVAAGGMYRTGGYVEIAPYNDNPNATHWFRKALVAG